LGSAAIERTADRDLHCIDFEQRLYLLVHDLHLSTVNSKKGVSGYVDTGGALSFKWITILYRCWQTRTPYDEVTYLNALKRRDSPLLN
jgi:hypothetical protein